MKNYYEIRTMGRSLAQGRFNRAANRAALAFLAAAFVAAFINYAISLK